MTILDSNTIPSGGASVVTTNFVNRYTVSNTSTPSQVVAGVDTVVTLSGALTANTYKTMLNITGTSGNIPQLGLFCVDGTSRAIKLKVTLDGAYAKEITSSTIAAINVGIIAAGTSAYAATTYLIDGEPLRFKTSCLVEIQSSLTETDKIELRYKYFTEA